jgi:hypothetical protein
LDRQFVGCSKRKQAIHEDVDQLESRVCCPVAKPLELRPNRLPPSKGATHRWIPGEFEDCVIREEREEGIDIVFRFCCVLPSTHRSSSASWGPPTPPGPPNPTKVVILAVAESVAIEMLRLGSLSTMSTRSARLSPFSFIVRGAKEFDSRRPSAA